MVNTIEDSFAPYASSKAVIDVIRRYRERGLPDPLTTGALEQVGVAPTMGTVALQALRFLCLIDEGGNRLEAFERLRRASSDEYPQLLGEVIRKAYLPIFTIADPAEDGDVAIADAFRRYDPSNQRNKMIRLFRGLCEEAGIIEPQPKRKRTATPKPAAKALPSTPRSSRPILPPNEPPRPAEDPPGPDFRLISAVIQQLPREGHWISERRQRWLEAMTSAVDLLFEVTEEDTTAVEE